MIWFEVPNKMLIIILFEGLTQSGVSAVSGNVLNVSNKSNIHLWDKEVEMRMRIHPKLNECLGLCGMISKKKEMSLKALKVILPKANANCSKGDNLFYVQFENYCRG